MKTKINLPKNAVRILSATALIASGMFMLASCSKDEVTSPIIAPVNDDIALRTDAPVITMKHTNCAAGNCAEYDFKAYNDGWVIYNGYSNVAKIGHIEFQAEKSLPDALAQLANDNGFFKLKNSYPFKDGTSISYETVLFNKKLKGVTDYDVSVPDNLTSIKQTFLDKLGITPLITVLTTSVTPIISLKHDGGAGKFPEYNVTLFADGKMVYEGLNNVKVLGKVEMGLPKEIVTDLVNFAKDNGFLDLKDGYPFSPDQQGTQTTIVIGTITKSVMDYSIEVPDNLVMIKKTIEEKLGIPELTGI